MKKIAMLTCLDAARSVCTGAGCLQAFNGKSGAFEQYGAEELELSAFFHCNGCENASTEDPGMQEKLERILSIQPDAVHLGVCTIRKDGTRCPVIRQYTDFFLSHGIRVINGTHGSSTVPNIGEPVK